MSRVTTSNYGAAPTTQFAWATTDDDLFDREQDLYRLAQAVENHDHSSTRGLAVARLAADAVNTAAIQALAVTTDKIANLAVTTGKIADNAVTLAKIADGNISTAKLADLNVTASKIADGNITTAKIANLNVTGGKIAAATIDYDKMAPLTGQVLWTTTTGAKIGLYGTTFGLGVSAGQINLFGVGLTWGLADDAAGTNFRTLYHTGNLPATVSVPLGAVVWFRTAAELTAAGASWATEGSLGGRIPYGAGTTFSQTFTENTDVGSSWSHTHTTPSHTHSVSTTTNGGVGGSVSSGGGSTASPTGHTHDISTISGGNNPTTDGTAWIPPGRVGVFGRRIA